MKSERKFLTNKLYIAKVTECLVNNVEAISLTGFVMPLNNIINYEYYSVVQEYSKGVFIDIINNKKYYHPWKPTIKNMFDPYHEIELENGIIDLCQQKEITNLEALQILNDFCKERNKKKMLIKG